MEADQWIKQLEESFRPYPEFVLQIAQKIAELEKATLVSPSPEPRAPARKVEVNGLSEKQVLLVDHAEINRVLASHYFKGLPVKLEFASTEGVARERCRTQSFDLVLLGEGLNRSLESDLPKAIPLQSMLGTKDERIEKLKTLLWK